MKVDHLINKTRLNQILLLEHVNQSMKVNVVRVFVYITIFFIDLESIFDTENVTICVNFLETIPLPKNAKTDEDKRIKL